MDAIVYDKVGKEAEKVREALYGIYPQETITDAAIASFDDGADSVPVKKLVAKIEPVQDLHGYANPWPDGGNINLLPTAQSKTQNGITFAVQSDGSINISGTATAIASIDIGRGKLTLPAGTYRFEYYAGAISGISTSVWADGSPAKNLLTGTGPFTVNNESSVFVRFSVSIGNTVNFTAYPMIKAGETATDYVPYSNICPISGHTGAEISNAAVNIWDEEWEVGQYNATTGEKADNANNIRSKNFISCKPNTTYSFVWDGWTAWAEQILFYDANYNFLNERKSFGSLPSTFTTPANASYMTFFMGGLSAYNHDISINYPATDTEYHPYTGNQISVNWEDEAGTVYGGTLTINPDRTGTLVVDRACDTFDGVNKTVMAVRQSSVSGNWYSQASLSHTAQFNGWLSTAMSNMLKAGVAPTAQGCFSVISNGDEAVFVLIDQSITTVSAFNAYLADNPIQMCYILATPITIPLTESEISAILTTLYGTNNIWANTGDIEKLTYHADLGKYIDSHITTAVANALNA